MGGAAARARIAIPDNFAAQILIDDSVVNEACSTLPFSLFSSEKHASVRAEEKSADWTEVESYDLQVDVLDASGLGEPEWRVGDLVSRGLGNASIKAYVEVQLAACKLQTGCGQLRGRRSKSACGESSPAGGDSVDFANEQVLHFPYGGEREVRVRVRDQRRVQALLRGDPLFGEGILEVCPSELRDGESRSAELCIKREGLAAGKVSLRYQLKKQ